MKHTITLVSLSLFFTACSHTNVNSAQGRQPANKVSERHCDFTSIHDYSATLNEDGNYMIGFSLGVGSSQNRKYVASGGNVDAILSILEAAKKMGKSVCVVSENGVATQITVQ